MNRYEYILILIKHIPQDSIDQYNLRDLIINDHVLIEIPKCMYSLPQVGLIVQ